MGFYLAQAGASLQAISPSGQIFTLTLPAGVTIDPTVTGEFLVLNRYVIFGGASSVTLRIRAYDLTVFPLGLVPPTTAPTLAAGSGTGITGVVKGAYSFLSKDADGNVISESPLSPTSPIGATLANQSLVYSAVATSTDPAVTGRRFYRTGEDGSVLFQILGDLDDNTSTTFETSATDDDLNPTAATVDTVNPPGTVPGTAVQCMTQWKGHAWLVGNAPSQRDLLVYTNQDETRIAAANSLPARPVGADAFGVVGFLARRDYLGVAKRGIFLKVAGDDNSSFEVITVADEIVCASRDSCVVIRDKGYFLGLDGVYRWDDDGIVCLTKNSVDGWFTTDTYFNRSRFPNAFASWNPITNAYELALAAAGSSVEDRWIAFQLDANGGKGGWFGPHQTAAATPTSRATLQASSGAFFSVVGASDGYLYAQNQGLNDEAATSVAISSLLVPRWYHEGAPDIEHYWGQLSVLARIESAGTLSITPTTGRLDTAAQSALTMDLTLGRQRLARLGVGALLSLSFAQNALNQRWLVFGFDIDRVFEVGRR